jgi:phosphoserine phosphatase
MDSTIITIECIDELADFSGLKAEVAAVTRRAMNGELDFAAALEARVALLAGLPDAALDEVIRERLRLMPGAVTLVRTMRARAGALTALVSGGFTAFTGHVRELCGFDLDEANRLEIADGRLTGRIVPPLRDAGTKLAALERLRAERHLDPAGDPGRRRRRQRLAMIRAAGAWASPAAPTRACAPRRRSGWSSGDLTALLYLQGYAPGRVRHRRD